MAEVYRYKGTARIANARVLCKGEFHLYSQFPEAKGVLAHRMSLECKGANGEAYRMDLTHDEAVNLFAWSLREGGNAVRDIVEEAIERVKQDDGR